MDHIDEIENTSEIIQPEIEDIPILADLEVEAFISKYQTALGESDHNLQIAKDLDQEEWNYFFETRRERTGIIRDNEKCVAVCYLSFKGDKEPDAKIYTWDRVKSSFGFSRGMRFAALGTAMAPEEAGENECYLDHICVDANYRGKKYGTKLLQWAEDEAIKRNKTSIYLWVAKENTGAAKLYSSVGYEILDNTPSLLNPFFKTACGYKGFHKMVKKL